MMFNYKKIIVIGCPGSGKSTFSTKLQKATGIDLFYLDAIYWNKDCSHITRDEFINKQNEILAKESYIIDGNFRNTLEMRIANADLIFLFDLPIETCINGAKDRIGNRPEMPCELPVNEELINFIKNFNSDIKPLILALINKHGKKVITFHSHQEADNYIEKLNSVDLTLNTTKGIFNHRVAAVIIHNNKILAQKNTKANEYYLVGGRVRYGESTEDSLVREIAEELNTVVSDFKPLWVNECFFVDEGKHFHEIGVYYLVNINNTNFHHFESVFETQEANRTNTYEWLDIDNLDNVLLYPLFIKDEIKNPNKNLKLIITKEI